MQLQVEQAVVDRHRHRRTIERVGHGAGEIIGAGLDDRLHGRGQVGAVIGEHRGPGADLRPSRRRVGVGPEAVVEPPVAQSLPHHDQLRGRARPVGQDTSMRRQVADELVEAVSGIGCDLDVSARPAHQRRRAPGRGPGEDHLAFDLGVASECGLLGLRQAQIHQIAEIVGGVTEFDRHRTRTRTALGGAGPTRTTEVFGAGPQRRSDAALTGEGPDHLAAPAIGQQAQCPVQR